MVERERHASDQGGQDPDPRKEPRGFGSAAWKARGRTFGYHPVAHETSVDDAGSSTASEAGVLAVLGADDREALIVGLVPPPSGQVGPPQVEA